MDSSKVNSASTECMDCHATATALARNDRKGIIARIHFLKMPKFKQVTKDSRTFTQNAPSVSEPQAVAVEMRNRGFQGAGEGIYLSGNEQARAAESTIYRSKPAIAVQGEAQADFFRNATPNPPA